MVPRCTLTGGPAGSAWVPERGRARPAVRRGCRIRWVCRSAPHRSAVILSPFGALMGRGGQSCGGSSGGAVSKDPVLVGEQALGVAQAHLAVGPLIRLLVRVCRKRTAATSCRASRKCSGHCEKLVRQARSARRWARAAFFTRCPAGSPPRGLPAGYGSAWCSGSAGPVSAARAWIRGVPRRRSRVPTGRRPPRWYASSTPRCA